MLSLQPHNLDRPWLTLRIGLCSKDPFIWLERSEGECGDKENVRKEYYNLSKTGEAVIRRIHPIRRIVRHDVSLLRQTP